MSENRPYHELTLRQFTARRLREIRAEYACSYADARDCLAIVGAERAHLDACYAFVSAGGELRREVLDSMGRDARYRVLHDFPSQHNWYIPAIVRRGQAAIRDAFDAPRVEAC